MTDLRQQLHQRLNTLLKMTALSLTDGQKQQLVAFVGLLDKWNRTYNLTSVRDPQDMLIKHILDSLVVSPYLQGSRFIDVGTGPGLPGLPLAIINPDKQFCLLDSLGKRISFIRHAVRELEIGNVEPVLSRVEDYHPESGFDGILSRAFASLKDMTERACHLRRPQGRFYALKGIFHPQEAAELAATFQIEQVIPLLVPELDAQRHLVIIR